MRFIIFGKIPPPIGGVTISILNLMLSLSNLSFERDLFDVRRLVSYFWGRSNNVGHVNWSNPKKRLIYCLISKLICKKTVFVVHGSNFNSKNFFNNLSLKVANGVIVLNQQVYDHIHNKHPKMKIFKQTSIFLEGMESTDSKFLNNHIHEEIERKTKFNILPIVLFYTNNNKFRNGKEVYGTGFFIDSVKEMVVKNEIFVLFIDLSGTFESRIKEEFKTGKYLYISDAIDFKYALSLADVYVRTTNYDGSSVAVLEAIQSNTPVLVSDVIDRPSACYIYKSENRVSFLTGLKKCLTGHGNNVSDLHVSSVSSLLDFIKTI